MTKLARRLQPWAIAVSSVGHWNGLRLAKAMGRNRARSRTAPTGLWGIRYNGGIVLA